MGLVNAGPTRDGMIPTIMEERLRQMGQWLEVNGEAVYATRPWGVQNDTLTTGVWYTKRDNFVYAHVLSWPENDTLTLGSVRSTDTTAMSLLGDSVPNLLKFIEGENGVEVQFPPQERAPRAKWVWVIKMLYVDVRALFDLKDSLKVQ